MTVLGLVHMGWGASDFALLETRHHPKQNKTEQNKREQNKNKKTQKTHATLLNEKRPHGERVRKVTWTKATAPHLCASTNVVSQTCE